MVKTTLVLSFWGVNNEGRGPKLYIVRLFWGKGAEEGIKILPKFVAISAQLCLHLPFPSDSISSTDDIGPPKSAGQLEDEQHQQGEERPRRGNGKE